MNETMRLDDMRIAAELHVAKSLTAVARKLAMPKQTVSRRLSELEASLGVRLVDRNTRTFRVTALGRAYAERCVELVRLAAEVTRDVRGEATEVTGTLRVTADPLFGEMFLPPIVAAFVRAHPEVKVDVTLTSRSVDLVDEGFDFAFRVGAPGDPSLVATRIADAALVYVASPKYLARHGRPREPEDLAKHDLVALTPEASAPRWAFLDAHSKKELRWVPIAPRIRVNHLGLARAAALEGLGIANLPRFACADDVARGALALVLEDQVAPFGAIWIVHPARRLVTPRTRAFRELALEHLAARAELGPIRRRAKARP